ncbi:hypothetical protein D3C80_1362500 [compost metagenome]
MRHFGPAVRQPDAGYAGIHFMCTALKHAQHSIAVLRILRLAQYFTVQHDNSVAADNDCIPIPGGRHNGFRLAQSQGMHDHLRCIICGRTLIRITDQHLERQAKIG